MNCRSYSDALTAMLDEELTADEKRTVQAHLSGCPDCQKEYDSLAMAFDLTEQVDSIPLNPALWTRIQNEVTSSESSRVRGFGAYLRMFLTPRWRPVAAAVGAVAVAVILFFSVPFSKIDGELEEEFTEFFQEREAISRENERILFEPQPSRNHRMGNPFVKPVSSERTNPFRE